jgi:gliding motility-associated protein GldL
MGLNNIVKSKGFKNFMAKLYGIGASVVILGALFKINHYDGADIMLLVGLSTEAIIFFFSAFEPPHVEPDWSLVYPELAGMYHGIPDGGSGQIKGDGLTEDLDNMLAEAKIGPELIESLGVGLRSLSDNTNKLKDVADASVASNEFADKLKDATKSVGTLSESYEKQVDTINIDIEASQEHLSAMQNASKSVGSLSEVYSDFSNSIKNDVDSTAEFANSVKAATQSANQLAENYTKSADVLAKSADALDFTSMKENNYGEQLQKLSANLASLNSIYENQLQNTQAQSESANKLNDTYENFVSNLNTSIENTVKYQTNLASLNTAFESQLKGTTDHVDTTAKLKDTLDAFLGKLNDSTDKTLKYNEQLDDLSKKVEALNKVYGNMLSAMNVKTDA